MASFKYLRFSLTVVYLVIGSFNVFHIVQTAMDFNQPVAAEDRSAKDEFIETVIDPEKLENTTVMHTQGLSSLDSYVVVTFKTASEKDGGECSSERVQEVPQKTAACKGASPKNVPSVSSGGEIHSPHIKVEANAVTEEQAGAGGTQSSSKNASRCE